MEKLTPDLLPFRVYIQVRVTEALKSRYASDGGQGLGVTCYGCAFQRGMASQMLGGMQEYTEVPRAEEWAHKTNSAITVDSEHNSVLRGLLISQKKKWKNTQALNIHQKNEFIK